MSKMIASMVVSGALLLGACTESREYESIYPHPGFGDAVNQNLAVHIIDPDPAAAANTEINVIGTRAAVGHQRYLTDTVPPPRQLRTSDVDMGGEE